MKSFLIFLLIAAASSHDVSDDVCLGIQIDLIPHPTDCSKFIVCVFELPTVMQCRPNEIFNYESQICLPGEVNLLKLTVFKNLNNSR